MKARVVWYDESFRPKRAAAGQLRKDTPIMHFGSVGIGLRTPGTFRRRSDGATSEVGFTARSCAKSQAAEVCPTSEDAPSGLETEVAPPTQFYP